MLFKLSFVPEDFQVPETADASMFHLHPLRLADSPEDLAALMLDYDGHVAVFDPHAGTGLAYDAYRNQRELGWHENEFVHRASFTYVIRGKNPSLPSYRGCLYIFPTTKLDFDVEVYVWLAAIEHEPGFESAVVDWARSWMQKSWPFDSPLWPNRGVDWATYFELPGGRTYVGIPPS